MPRYETLAQLKAAYEAGSVTASLMLDNDHTSVYQVFAMHPQDLLEQALSLLGIPYDYV